MHDTSCCKIQGRGYAGRVSGGQKAKSINKLGALPSAVSLNMCACG